MDPKMTTAEIRRGNVDHAGGGGGRGGGGIARSGWVLFAGVMMIFGGTMAILEGIAAIRKDDVLVVTTNYAYSFDTTSWGWVHLGLGIVVILAGLALFTGALWARAIAVLLAGLAMIANFLWIPYYPFWAIVLIAINAFVIWAVCTTGGRQAHLA